MSLFHKSSFGCSNKDESDGKCNSTAIPIRTATRTVANVNDSSLMENSSTPSRRQQMTDLKDRINDLEEENGFLHYQIDEKDAEIESLKTEILELKSQHNPDNLVESKT
ncbi:Uncharacterized protein APZ42_004905 [Daphnia magna]|uniref:Uncharacterized protein n=1 Tax=Daphnia magna TaxID=35525 RepID=A0A164GS04_9CRUS|nr:Uncharacterized protein APZ42_004905 [Daphnia magna]